MLDLRDQRRSRPGGMQIHRFRSEWRITLECHQGPRNRILKVSTFNLCVQEIPNELPYNDYFEYFGPDFKLHIAPSNMANQNTGEYVDKIRSRLVSVKVSNICF